MAEKVAIRLDQIFGGRVIDTAGTVVFTMSGTDGTEVSISCAHNELVSVINQLQNLHQEAHAKAKAAPLN